VVSSTVYSYATVDATMPLNPIPHVRSVVHRTFISPSENTHLLAFTTDVRTPKVKEAVKGSDSRGEIMWWIAGSSEQYRFNGVVHILPHPAHPLAKIFPAERLAPEKAEDGGSWDWEKERLRLFDEKMSPDLRASFVRPAPDTVLQSYDEAGKWPQTLPKSYEIEEGDGKTKALVEEALRNFSVVVFEPQQVDWVELGVVPNRRTKFEKTGEEWKEWIVVP